MTGCIRKHKRKKSESVSQSSSYRSWKVDKRCRTIFVIVDIDGPKAGLLDLTHFVRIVRAVYGVREAVVPDDVDEAREGEEEDHDPGHPGESDDGCQEPARAVSVAPVKVSPVLSGDDGTNDPQDEEEQESN